MSHYRCSSRISVCSSYVCSCRLRLLEQHPSCTWLVPISCKKKGQWSHVLAAKYSVLEVTHNLHSELIDQNMLQSHGLIQLKGAKYWCSTLSKWPTLIITRSVSSQTVTAVTETCTHSSHSKVPLRRWESGQKIFTTNQEAIWNR